MIRLTVRKVSLANARSFIYFYFYFLVLLFPLLLLLFSVCFLRSWQCVISMRFCCSNTNVMVLVSALYTTNVCYWCVKKDKVRNQWDILLRLVTTISIWMTLYSTSIYISILHPPHHTIPYWIIHPLFKLAKQQQLQQQRQGKKPNSNRTSLIT